MELVGHQTESIYRRYAITNEQDLRDGLQKVAALQEAIKRQKEADRKAAVELIESTRE